MNAALTPFAFEESLVRVRRDERGEPWFVGKDVAKALEYEEVVPTTFLSRPHLTRNGKRTRFYRLSGVRLKD
ncbi:MAG: hypothetical protein LBC94_05450 [Desulfovibrio sp.]|jgi:prophage antirepressor-like protein|nr:hypothetical protein [Desulfovibrio sp.]